MVSNILVLPSFFLNQKKRGSDGCRGIPGKDGSDGHDSKAAEFGSVCFAHLSSSGSVIESSGLKYEATVCGYRVRGKDLDDGVFEPGETVIIDQLLVFNSGELTLPAGAIVRFPKTNDLQAVDVDDAFVLPSIPPKGNYSVPQD